MDAPPRSNLPAPVADWERRADRHATPSGDGTLAWRCWGSGPPLLLVHGGAGSWAHWIRNLAVLTRHRRVLVPDLPGLGDSAAPPRPHTPEGIAAIVRDGLRRLVPHHAGVDIAGFSFGGMIAGLVAAGIGAQVRTLAVIGSAGLGGRLSGVDQVRRLPPARETAALAAAHRHNLAVMMLHHARSIDPLALWIQATNAPRTRVNSPRHALSHKLARALPQIDAPVTTLWGEHCIFARDLVRRRALLRAVRPDAAFHVIAGAGHWAQYERADAVNRLLVRALDLRGP